MARDNAMQTERVAVSRRGLLRLRSRNARQILLNGCRDSESCFLWDRVISFCIRRREASFRSVPTFR
jgi:hypothetical protein